MVLETDVVGNIKINCPRKSKFTRGKETPLCCGWFRH